MPIGVFCYVHKRYYNHAFTIAFTVVSSYDHQNVTMDEFRHGLKRRIIMLRKNYEELEQAASDLKILKKRKNKMGDRGEVYIKDEGIRLYTHSGATKLIETVKNALRKKWRWDDPQYLSRIIFDEMIGDHQGTEAGFGISSVKSDAWCVVKVDCKNQMITIKKYKKVVNEQSFEKFIK